MRDSLLALAAGGQGQRQKQSPSAVIPAPALLEPRLEANIWRLGWKVGVLELSLTGCTGMRAQMTDPHLTPRGGLGANQTLREM